MSFMKRVLLGCLMLLVVLPSLSSRAAGVPTSVTNASFEAGSGSSIPGWTAFSVAGGLSKSSDAQRDGSYSLKLYDASTTANAGAISDPISVAAGSVHKIEGWVLQRDTVSDDIELFIRYYDGNGGFLNQFYTATSGLTPNQWTLLSVSGTAPAGAVEARILFYSSKGKTMTTYIDDIHFQQELRNPGFEEPVSGGMISGWSQTFGSGGITVSTGDKYSGTSSVAIQDSSASTAYGLESVRIPIQPGDTYKASAYVKVSANTGELYLRYYDPSGVLVGNHHQTIDAPVNQWTPVSVVAPAPAPASTAAVLLYSSKSNTATIHFDDIKLSSPFTDLGTQVYAVSVNKGTIGKDGNGDDLLYTVVQGNPAKLAVLDIETETLVEEIALPESLVAWALTVDANGHVYIGTTSNGHLFKYVPGDETVTDLGQAISGETSVWDLEWVDTKNKLYGGTADSNKVFKYTTSGGFLDLGSMAAGESHVRSLAYDTATDLLYAGVGSHAKLIEYDPSTGTKTDILPASYASETSVYDLDYVNGKLIAKVEPSYRFVILDPQTRTVIADFAGASRAVSSLSPIDDKMYYTYLNELYSYDFSSNATVNLGVDLQGEALNFDYVQLNDPNFPGYTLVGLAGNNGKMFKYNLSSGYVEVNTLPLPPQPIGIHEISEGPNGQIYSGGFVSGGVGIYDPTTGTNDYRMGIGQSEGIGVLNGNLYFGTYPKAKVYEYNPASAWEPDGSSPNPELLFKLDTEEQDRPMAVLGVEAENKVFVGTSPIYGELGGALTVYDAVSQTHTTSELVTNQSITALAYANGELFGGTSIWGGSGISPTEDYAKLFVYDVSSGAKVYETVPAQKALISSLIVGPDGNIWGLAHGTLFIFDPVNRSVIYAAEKFPGSGGRLKNGVLRLGGDGWVYGTINGDFFKIDPSSKDVTMLREKGDAYRLAQDNFGNLYFKNETSLWRYEPGY